MSFDQILPVPGETRHFGIALKEFERGIHNRASFVLFPISRTDDRTGIGTALRVSRRTVLRSLDGLLLTAGTSGIQPASTGRTVAAAALPSRLSDQEFWNLSRESSEEDGVFRSDNLLSNETSFQYIIPDLLKSAKQGRVYMGVGPEQNFTYIVALRPAMAFVIDIRHGNLDVHLLYKALFELSKDRSEC